MINYNCKHSGIQEKLATLGISLVSTNGVWVSNTDEAIVQDIIDTFDHLAYIKPDCISLIKEATAEKRKEYVTESAGKDAEYTMKAMESKQYNLDGSIGVWMQARIDATGETAQQVADEWTLKSNSWQSIGATISAIEDKAIMDISNETDWEVCIAIADTAIQTIKEL